MLLGCGEIESHESSRLVVLRRSDWEFTSKDNV